MNLVFHGEKINRDKQKTVLLNDKFSRTVLLILCNDAQFNWQIVLVSSQYHLAKQQVKKPASSKVRKKGSCNERS